VIDNYCKSSLSSSDDYTTTPSGRQQPLYQDTWLEQQAAL